MNKTLTKSKFKSSIRDLFGIKQIATTSLDPANSSSRPTSKVSSKGSSNDQEQNQMLIKPVTRIPIEKSPSGRKLLIPKN